MELLGKIVDETNRYATYVLASVGSTMGDLNWEPLIINGLKAFFAIALYMGMKKKTKHQKLLGKKGFIFQLFHNFKHHVKKEVF